MEEVIDRFIELGLSPADPNLKTELCKVFGQLRDVLYEDFKQTMRDDIMLEIAMKSAMTPVADAPKQLTQQAIPPGGLNFTLDFTPTPLAEVMSMGQAGRAPIVPVDDIINPTGDNIRTTQW